MDAERWLQLKSILIDAFEEESTDARRQFVLRSCSGDRALLHDAESLLAEAEILRRSANDDLEACAEHAERRIPRDTTAPIGRRIGAYAVEREIGRGGMGIVYLAARADGYFEKQVAIKVLKPGAETAEMVTRFHSERQLVARLEHPNIARLLDAGTTEDGSQYFVMEYVEGVPVTRFLEQNNAPIPERLEVFLKICSAVQAAHAKSVVHRDLKASNILITESGDVKLLDFGIAKTMLGADEPSALEGPAGELLTPICASPEQARGEAATVSTDVYALGVLLYEILTARRPLRFPHPHPTLEELVTVLCEQRPRPPSAVVEDEDRRRLLQGDLDAIVLRAIEKNPTERYASVKEFADDIRRHVGGLPIEARSADIAYILRAALQNRLVRFGLAIVAVAFVSSLVFFGHRFISTRNPSGAAKETGPGENGIHRPPPNESVAVLPFRNVGPGSSVLPFDGVEQNGADSYFADGIHAEIVAGLAQLAGLKVISRDSVAAYRGSRDSRSVGEALGVAYVVEGSVQKLDDRFRINAHLTRVRDDTSVWEYHTEKPLGELFSVEDQILQAVAAQLQVRLAQEETTKLAVIPTPSFEAYDFYLRGLHAFHQRDFLQAIDLLHAAVKRDPEFVPAHCLVSKAYLDYFRFVYPSDESLAAAREAAETALRLAPQMPDSHLAMARYYRIARDFDREWNELQAIGAPRDRAEFQELLALAERREGHWKEALRDGETALESAPQNQFVAIELLETYIALRLFKEAETLLDRVTKQVPTDDDVISIYRSYCALGQGKLEEARAVLERAPVRTVWGTNRLIQLAIYARDLDRASALIAAVPPDKKYSMSSWQGRIAQMRGEPEKAREFYLSEIDANQSRLLKRPDDLESLSALSLAYAALGRKEDALRYANHAIEIVPLSRNAIDAPAQMLVRAQVYAQLGEKEAALEELARIVPMPAGPNYGTLKFDPVWDDLRSAPRFQEIMARATRDPDWN